MIKNQFGDNPPLVVEKDKIIINDHVINSNDPTIIDVLSKHEQGHLFGTHDGRPMAIEIVAGLPMKYPTQVRVPGGGEVNHDEINYVPTQYDQPPPPQKSSNNGRVPPPPPPPKAPITAPSISVPLSALAAASAVEAAEVPD